MTIQQLEITIAFESLPFFREEKVMYRAVKSGLKVILPERFLLQHELKFRFFTISFTGADPSIATYAARISGDSSRCRTVTGFALTAAALPVIAGCGSFCSSRTFLGD